ncbi:hypothetical protein [Maritalea porphyrae]|uniref:hypothetical protein n=1 Tax=Maritalea porphyrae TaxID=880732 RepID=UPI0022AE7698|nr:hypothetical protein [Maritalea porphyrae]MCZ4270878.1 hypothetical protein [Maritalea porphyrae]
MANCSNTKINGLLPIDFTQFSIRELSQAYDAALAADLALIGVLSRPGVEIDEVAGGWMDEQAQAFTFMCQCIRDEMLTRSEPECSIEACMRRDVVIGYALRCGDSTDELGKLLVDLSNVQQKAA